MASQQKYGRGLRTPSRKAYKTLRKWETNKIRNIKQHLKWCQNKMQRMTKRGMKVDGIEKEIKLTMRVLKGLT